LYYSVTIIAQGLSQTQTQTHKITASKRKAKSNKLPLLEGEAYNTLKNSITCNPTLQVYTSKLRGFMTFLHFPVNEVDKLLMDNDIKLVQKCIIDFIIYLREERSLSSSAILSYATAIKYFYDINDVSTLNWSKIYKSLPEYKTVVKDGRAYTREEIAKMLSVANEREKLIVLLQCAAGLRKGALPALTLGDIKRYPEPNSYPKVYEIIVYRGTKDEYFSLTTPELSDSIEKYLEFRRRFGELEMDENTPLLREEFDTTDSFAAAHPKQLKSENTIDHAITKLIYRTGLRQKKNSDNGSQPFMRRNRHTTTQCHSLRRFFDTECTNSGMKLVNIELLMGHSLNSLKHRYYKPKKGDIFEEFLKAINGLTISEERRLKEEVKELRVRADDIDKLKFELDEIKKSLKG
jgi:integrase